MKDQVHTTETDAILDGLNLHDYSDWRIFVGRLDKLVEAGILRRISSLRGKPLEGEEWYLEEKTGNLYLYLLPDAPLLPEWKKIDPFVELEFETSRNLSDFEMSEILVGRISRADAVSLLTRLHIMLGFGRIEAIAPKSPMTIGITETWYRDVRTGAVYRLVEGSGENDSFWEPVPSAALSTHVQ